MIIILHCVLYKFKCELYYFTGIYLIIVGVKWLEYQDEKAVKF